MALKSDGKPMRALRYLATQTRPVYEADVWAALSWRPKGENIYWGDALRTLYKRGLAERHGEPGGFSYTITDAGRDVLDA